MNLPRFSTPARGLAVAAGLLLAGCAATGSKLNSTWKNPDHDGKAMTRIAVFVLAKDENIRRFAEDQMTQRLPPGTVGVPGHRMFEKPEPDREKIRARLIKDGFDGALVSRLVSADTTQTYVPPQTYIAPAAGFGGMRPNYGSFNGYYGYAYSGAYTMPGYTVENTTVVVETLLYRLADDMLVWTGTTRTFNPQSKPEMVQAIADLVEAEMQKQGVVGK